MPVQAPGQRCKRLGGGLVDHSVAKQPEAVYPVNQWAGSCVHPAGSPISCSTQFGFSFMPDPLVDDTSVFIRLSDGLTLLASSSSGVGQFLASSDSTFPPVPGFRLPGFAARGVGHSFRTFTDSGRCRLIPSLSFRSLRLSHVSRFSSFSAALGVGHCSWFFPVVLVGRAGLATSGLGLLRPVWHTHYRRVIA